MSFDIDKIEQIKKYIKYIILLIPIVIILIIIKGCSGASYSDLEVTVKSKVLEYINTNQINITSERYIDLTMLPEIEGLELCSSASGALVENRNGNIVITPFLDCNGYKSQSLQNKSKYIELNGDSIMLLNVGEVFNEPLYVLKKECDVEIDGFVGSSPGIYTIKYNVYVNGEQKETLYRKVVVTNTDKSKTISGVEDPNVPTLILYGDSEIVLTKGEKYVEPGYKAVDYVDGKISRQVKVDSSELNTKKAGVYKIKYMVQNSRGAITIKERRVNVVLRKANLNIELTSTLGANNKATLKMKVTGADYDCAYLPDRTKVTSREMTYEVNRNGTYSFQVYDIYGNLYTKDITVDIIDEVAPYGSCKAVVKKSSTSISVTASDDKGIGGYNYILDGKESGYISNNNYELNVESENVKVKVKDISGNVSTLTCEVEQKKTTIASGACGESDIYITINTCFGNKLIRQDVPLEEYLMGVLYGEENPSLKDPEAYIKAFLIFARSYTLERIGYWKGNNKAIKSCSSDQNWCDLDTGCYRDQTQEMFDLCIDYAINYSRKTYTSSTCANRVTTFPGTANVRNKTFYVSNSRWWGDSSVTSNHILSMWHGPISEAKREFYQRMVEETAGLIIYDSSGKPASVHYYMCDDTSKGDTMCPNTAEVLAKQGYTMEELIRAYSGNYPGRIVECYNK